MTTRHPTGSTPDRRSPLISKIESALAQSIRGFPGHDFRVVSVRNKGRDATGRPIYAVAYKQIAPGAVGTTGATQRFFKTFTIDDAGKMDAPRTSSGVPRSPRPSEPGGGGEVVGGGDSAAEERLRQAKDAAMKRIRGMNLPADFESDIISSIESYKGGVFGLNNMVEIRLSTIPLPEGGGFGDGTGGVVGGGGGGGGFTGPEYVAPDRRVVEDTVKGTMISLIGTVDEQLLNKGVDLFMRDHRRNFDNTGEEISPIASVMELIRGTEDYKVAHQSRPESADERRWISERLQAARSGGLDTAEQEDFAITQATVGGDIGDVETAAAVRQTKQSGTTRGTSIEDRMRQTARKTMAGVI